MRCNACHAHAVFERSVFLGTKPETVRLCQPCADSIDVHKHMDAINEASDHEHKNAAVNAFLEAVHAKQAEKAAAAEEAAAQGDAAPQGEASSDA